MRSLLSLILAPSALIAAMLADVDPISGGAGYIGAGLLGAVLGWLLLKHLPDKDRQLENLLTNKDKQMQELLTNGGTQMQNLLVSKDTQLTDQLALERAACEKRHTDNLAEWRLEREIREKRHAELMTEFRLTHSEEKELRHAVNGLTQTVMLWVAVVRQVTGIEEKAVPGVQPYSAPTNSTIPGTKP